MSNMKKILDEIFSSQEEDIKFSPDDQVWPSSSLDQDDLILRALKGDEEAQATLQPGELESIRFKGYLLAIKAKQAGKWPKEMVDSFMTLYAPTSVATVTGSAPGILGLAARGLDLYVETTPGEGRRKVIDLRGQGFKFIEASSQDNRLTLDLRGPISSKEEELIEGDLTAVIVIRNQDNQVVGLPILQTIPNDEGYLVQFELQPDHSAEVTTGLVKPPALS
ncbi:MAG: hypothetical protein MUC92_01815 [Fimbriimonadaceae bacterium]|jgi:hypothetical protein|nr:hypothetical protein [Fimbriimonadaceae bacterium]